MKKQRNTFFFLKAKQTQIKKKKRKTVSSSESLTGFVLDEISAV